MQLPKTYEPGQYEDDIYTLWEKAGAFTPQNRGSEGSYSIVVPPPNANGNLHLGHGLTLALEDIAVRYHRMKGEASLLLPGADHAGFETQVVYEKELAKQGKSRFDFSREELYQQIWDFVAQNKTNYESQFRRLGASVDWTRYTYTLDDTIVRTAYDTFKKMWDEGLIYRGERLVNYCTHHRTGFADIEVAYEDAKTPLYYLKYGPFELATTRPETKFGDTAVAVHPDDKRHQQWVGKTVTVEGVNGPFEVMVIADEMVNPEFGTGVVKITPAHSFDDWEVAQRHNLPAVRVIDHDGTLNEKTGPFRGMTVLEGRQAVVAALQEKGLLVKVDEDYQTRIGTCYKCGTIIEPMLMEQWFIDMKPLAGPAIEALQQGKVGFRPDTKRKQLITYLESLRDWNISRQIAWGIPIPAFQNVDDTDDWIYDERVNQEIIEVDDKTYRRDPDVFDTWFSSASWPYATLDYPDGEDYKRFYPLSLMETAADILYPWVSRMLMFGLYNTGRVPFEEVYLHGLIMDEKGQKMSKSKGNVIDPMGLLDEFGSDAFRGGIVLGEAPGSNRPFDRGKVIGARNFGNKLWNVARFIESQIGDDFDARHQPEPNAAADYYILSHLQQLTEVVTAHCDNYRFSEAYAAVYHFVWNELADWYVEASKVALNKGVLAHALEVVLKLAHPFAPFVTETIWQTLKWEDGLLAVATWPEGDSADMAQAKDFAAVKDIVSEIRFVMSTLDDKDIPLHYIDSGFMSANVDLITSLARLKRVEAIKAEQKLMGLKLTQTTEKLWLDLDVDAISRLHDTLTAKVAEQQQAIKHLKGRLSNKSYVNNAPAALVQETRDQLETAEGLLANLEKEAARFSD